MRTDEVACGSLVGRLWVALHSISIVWLGLVVLASVFVVTAEGLPHSRYPPLGCCKRVHKRITAALVMFEVAHTSLSQDVDTATQRFEMIWHTSAQGALPVQVGGGEDHHVCATPELQASAEFVFDSARETVRRELVCLTAAAGDSPLTTPSAHSPSRIKEPCVGEHAYNVTVGRTLG
jgi:hypothetical protein